MQKSLVFTDLDGTLLDDRYDLAGAADALDQVYAMGAVAIPVSSKTRAEMLLLRRHQRHPTPFVFENGAGIDWGDAQHWAPEMSTMPSGMTLHGLGYAQLCQRLTRLRSELDINFCGFSELSAEKVAELTKLSLVDAGLAKRRTASEPLVWLDDQQSVAKLKQALAKHDLLLQKGGRFYTATSLRQKNDAISEIIALLNKQSWRPRRVIVCGDSPNDLSMLALADMALLFSDMVSDHGDTPGLRKRMKEYLMNAANPPEVLEVNGAGHESWLTAIDSSLSDLKQN